MAYAPSSFLCRRASNPLPTRPAHGHLLLLSAYCAQSLCAGLSAYCAQSFSTLPPPPEVGGLASPMTARRSSAATLSPALTRTRSTMPVAGAGMTVSIFMDERTCKEGRNQV